MAKRRNNPVPQTHKDLVRALERRGWVMNSRGRHLKMVSPDGAILVVSKSASDWRAMQNLLSQCRKLGVQW